VFYCWNEMLAKTCSSDKACSIKQMVDVRCGLHSFWWSWKLAGGQLLLSCEKPCDFHVVLDTDFKTIVFYPLKSQFQTSGAGEIEGAGHSHVSQAPAPEHRWQLQGATQQRPRFDYGHSTWARA
jgi:hypothetical protein